MPSVAPPSSSPPTASSRTLNSSSKAPSRSRRVTPSRCHPFNKPSEAVASRPVSPTFRLARAPRAVSAPDLTTPTSPDFDVKVFSKEKANHGRHTKEINGAGINSSCADNQETAGGIVQEPNYIMEGEHPLWVSSGSHSPTRINASNVLVAPGSSITRMGFVLFWIGGILQRMSSALVWKDVMKYMIAGWLASVITQYEGKSGNYLAEKPITSWCFLISSLVYWLMIGIMRDMSTLNPPNPQNLMRDTSTLNPQNLMRDTSTLNSRNLQYVQELNCVALTVVAVSSMSLLSILLPEEVSLVPFAILALMLVVQARPLFSKIFSFIHAGIKVVVNKLHAAKTRFQGSSTTVEV